MAKHAQGAFTDPPDPGRISTVGELVEALRALKVWAGNPSYDVITGRINQARRAAGRPEAELARRTTVADCFRIGRRRLNTDLTLATVEALNDHPAYVAHWRQMFRVIAGETQAAAQVKVLSELPQDLAEFTGRTAEIDRLRAAVEARRQAGGAVVISAIEGMAGVGKTQLAVHAGHLLHRAEPFDHILFVNLRGFHPDPAQPPADPAAVLDGFLRLLGVSGHQIPHTLRARTAAYRKLLEETRALVLLDNAADEKQLEALLPNTPGSLAIVTSRRSLTELPTTTHLAVDVFNPDEAHAFLTRTLRGIPIGSDPHAADRIADRCGYLPLALGLVAGYIRATPGWTLTDHAERLDEHHRDRRLDRGVEMALDVSYRHLPTAQQRLLRLAAQHPGQDFDAYAAAAMCSTDLATAQAALSQLYRDHLLELTGPGRYTFHDLVRAYAGVRAVEEDRPSDRRGAVARLLDHYLAISAQAMDTLHPAEADSRPKSKPADSPAPTVTDPDAALSWLDTERQTLVALVVHATTHAWPTHSVRLAATLRRYLAGGYATEALTIHCQAFEAAVQVGDVSQQGVALTNFGATHSQLGQYRSATEHLQQALRLFQQAEDSVGQAHALHNLGIAEVRLGRYAAAFEHHEEALLLYQDLGNRSGEANTLTNLGLIEKRLGRQEQAAEHLNQALVLARETGHQTSEAHALASLGGVEGRQGRYEQASAHLQEALVRYRQLGHRNGEATALENLGEIFFLRGEFEQAIEHYRDALEICCETGEQAGEASALNGLAATEHASGQTAAALDQYSAANIIALDIGDPYQQARAQAGLGTAHRSLDRPARARRHFERAIALYTQLGQPEAEQLRTQLGTGSARGLAESVTN
ncbi:tetratricopeptide repeat protein [Kribbella sp. CA-293567]|uniref:tetratricopeptide repeat protein n=1 Tax=Kribbella sp. CA-293567 TaxID=3002436 RepID=UPI0022DE20DF|nr:tetratricopeptide repeat protein [Kribbella sp. CA-293567]WBQ05309.1 tetratricopeptide repeat protein [Kribbella sp. CA-293567]